MLALAWTHAKSFVTDHISILLTLPENMHQYVEMNMHERLSLADGIVLVHYLGLANAVEFISTVDPWQYSDEEEETPDRGVGSLHKAPLIRPLLLEICSPSTPQIAKHLTSSLRSWCKRGRDPISFENPRQRESHHPKAAMMLLFL